MVSITGNRFENIVGKKYGRLNVLSLYSKDAKGQNLKWLCRCDCGKDVIVFGGNLKNGHTISCSCHRKEAVAKVLTKHNHANSGKETPEYNAWLAMKYRCYNSTSNKAYKNYGGRGIKMCDRWLENFSNFLEDMGLRPSPKHSLDRYPDMNGNYTPENCRWATKKEQSDNRRNNVWIVHEGIRMTLQDWSNELGMFSSNLKVSIDRGVSFAKTINRRLKIINKKYDQFIYELKSKRIH